MEYPSLVLALGEDLLPPQCPKQYAVEVSSSFTRLPCAPGGPKFIASRSTSCRDWTEKGLHPPVFSIIRIGFKVLFPVTRSKVALINIKIDDLLEELV